MGIETHWAAHMEYVDEEENGDQGV